MSKSDLRVRAGARFASRTARGLAAAISVVALNLTGLFVTVGEAQAASLKLDAAKSNIEG
jgi:hypothetical protein